MIRGVLVAAVLGIGWPCRAQEVKVLSPARIFPADGVASAATLDVPLTDRIAAFRATHPKARFAKRIVISKSRRRMDVFADDTLLKSYIVNLGPEPEGAKQLQGDGRTPEGDLYVCSVNRVSQFTRFLALAYPAPADGTRGARSGLIDAKQAQAIAAAWKTRKACPPQTTRLGGQVGIHGKGGWERRGGGYALVDWTLGCIGLRDADILELFQHYAEVGIPVHIAP